MPTLRELSFGWLERINMLITQPMKSTVNQTESKKCKKETHLLFHPVILINGILVFWGADAQNRCNLLSKKVTH